MCNYLPYDVMVAQSLHEFRKEMDQFMEEKMTKTKETILLVLYIPGEP